VFNWFTDTQGSGLWGNQTPDPTYPLVRLPDGTVIENAMGNGQMIVFGGASFAADTNYFNAVGLDLFQVTILDNQSLPSTPADGTLVREYNDPRVFVVFGGAKFWIPDPPTLFALGFDWTRVRVIPSGGTAQLRTIPIDGTLLREQHNPRVFLVDNGQLRWVSSPASMDSHCLPWRHIRVVPDNALKTLATGPDLNA
jgi:hypothetical protein